ncbi:probable G-protein coupled receptor 139 isoform X2 [Periplaneta americana]|uniref:probable G-protein coupled receptor 139 isoform X2 n=1 Tax=Periplaneta americana TaxID=6978 RepID=UPI0037E82E69
MADNYTFLTDEGGTAVACAGSEFALESSAQFRDLSRFWIQRIFVPIVVGVGLLGNIVTIVVLTRRRMRSSTNVYLTALAVSDLLYLVFVFSLSFQHYPHIHNPGYLWYWQYYGFGTWFTDATSYTSIWLTVSFTVERYIAVCHPMRGRLICTESRARKVILLVYIFCFLTTVTTPLEYKAHVELDSRDNTTIISTRFTTTKMLHNETYQNVFYWYTTITFVFVPLILLGIFNSFLIHAVRKSQQQRCRMTQVEQCDSVQTQENKITITLIAVVILFMVCQIPAAITLIYKLFHQPPADSVGDNVLRGLGNIFNFLVTINAACNFMLYCALSDKYRRTFLITFCKSCYHPPLPSRHNTAFSSMYDGQSGFRRSVHASSVRVSASSSDNGKVFQRTSNCGPRNNPEQQSLPVIQEPAENNVSSPSSTSLPRVLQYNSTDGFTL